jgi:hypothetical protein
LAALVGVSVSRGNPPPSTVAAGNGSGGSSEGQLFSGFNLTGGSSGNRETEVLPVQNYGNATGLLRAGTANKARSILQQKWSTPSGGNGGGFMGFLKGIAKSIFPQAFGADKQNYKQRADDVTYEWMVKYYNDYTAVGLSKGVQNSGLSIGFMGINFKTNPSKTAITQVSNLNNLFKLKYYKNVNGENKIYIKEGSYFISNDDSKSELLEKFDDGKGNFNKLNDISKADTPASQINENLKRVIDNIKRNENYTINFDNKDFRIIVTSSANGAGVDISSYFTNADYNGTSYVTSAPSAGAFEFGSVINNDRYNYLANGNILPTVNAGVDQLIFSPFDSVVLTGTATDEDGTISSQVWTQISGPNTATLANETTLTLTASNLILGTYIFRLTATDNSGGIAFDDVIVNVNDSSEYTYHRFYRADDNTGTNSQLIAVTTDVNYAVPTGLNKWFRRGSIPKAKTGTETGDEVFANWINVL